MLPLHLYPGLHAFFWCYRVLRENNGNWMSYSRCKYLEYSCLFSFPYLLIPINHFPFFCLLLIIEVKTGGFSTVIPRGTCNRATTHLFESTDKIFFFPCLSLCIFQCEIPYPQFLVTLDSPVTLQSSFHFVKLSPAYMLSFTDNLRVQI